MYVTWHSLSRGSGPGVTLEEGLSGLSLVKGVLVLVDVLVGLGITGKC
jgi:hypothetical protein